MKPAEILSHPARVLSQAQREHYFELGYVCIESLVPAETIRDLNAVTEQFIERSRSAAPDDPAFDRAPEHTAEVPKLRRINQPVMQHPTYWDYANGIIADVAADLLGPNVLFHHSKLNFKWRDAAAVSDDSVRWHQDISFYPHTNFGVLAIGTYLSDVGPEDGPLSMLAGSQAGPVYDQYDGAGNWTGALSDADIAGLDLATARALPAPAGSITVHHCKMVHGSQATLSPRPRPLLINAYTGADAFPFARNPADSVHNRVPVRGSRVKWAHMDEGVCLTPPDWSGGYSSIYAHQAEAADGEAEAAD